MTKTVAPMVITKVITKHYKPTWFKRDFMVMSPEFKMIRANLGNSFDRCFGCRHRFNMGEDLHLVHFGSAGNKIVCTNCLNKLFGEKAKLEYWNKEHE